MLGELPTAAQLRNDLRVPLLVLAGLRGALAVVAIPLAPILWEDHLAVLVLLRPTKEVLLFAGYALRHHDISLGVVVVASLPLLVLGVWVFYFLGRAYADDLDDADLPGIAGRLLPRDRIQRLRDAVGDRGWPLVFLGRLASMPSTLVAAAAGAAEVPSRTFLLADLAGSLVSLGAMIGAGYVLGEARDEAGPWFTVVGAVAVLAVLTLVGQRLSGGGRRRGRSARASRS
jgi:membrane protein DedA with SNARE-associated domain